MKPLIITKINLALFFVFFFQAACAQIFVEQGSGEHQAPTVSVYGPGASSKKILLNRVKGSPFWKDEWQLASLYDNNANRINIVPVRMNFATDEFHFIWKEQELVAGNNDKVSLIVFHNNNDSSSIGTMFMKTPDVILDKKPLAAFVQIMNSGKYQLLKYTNRRVYPGEDSLFGTEKRYIFRDFNFYFLKTGDKVEKIKKLNAEHFLALVPGASTYKEWIKQNNLSFKREEDLLLFLNYYNSSLR